MVDRYVDLEYYTMTEVIEKVKEYIEKYGEKATFEVDYDDPWDSNARRLVLVIQREENDTEYANRLARDKEYKAYQLEQDRKKYEELKKQFEG